MNRLLVPFRQSHGTKLSRFVRLSRLAYRQQVEFLANSSAAHQALARIYEKKPAFPAAESKPGTSFGKAKLCRRWAQLEAEQAQLAEVLVPLGQSAKCWQNMRLYHIFCTYSVRGSSSAVTGGRCRLGNICFRPTSGPRTPRRRHRQPLLLARSNPRSRLCGGYGWTPGTV